MTDASLAVLEIFASCKSQHTPYNCIIHSFDDLTSTWSLVTKPKERRRRSELSSTYDGNNCVKFRFGSLQRLKVVVEEPSGKKRTIGSVDTFLAELVSSTKKSIELQLRKEDSQKNLIVRLMYKDISEDNDVIQFQFSGTSFDRKDLLGLSDPYLKLLRTLDDGSRQLVFRSEVQKNTLNPNFEAFQCSTQRLCGGDIETMLVIEVWDWNVGMSSDFIGEVHSNLRQLLSCHERSSTKLPLLNRKMIGSKGYQSSGLLEVKRARRLKQNNVVHYLPTLNLEVMLSMDLSGSACSLHESKASLMDQLLRLSSRSLLPHARRLSSSSFGARQAPPPTTVEQALHTSSTQQLRTPTSNDAGTSEICRGYEEWLEADAQFGGPSLLSPVLANAILQCYQAVEQHNQYYSLLVVITDGYINDAAEFSNGLVASSCLPLSVVVFALSDAPADLHDIATCDQLKSSSGVVAKRRRFHVESITSAATEAEVSKRFANALKVVSQHIVEELDARERKRSSNAATQILKQISRDTNS